MTLYEKQLNIILLKDKKEHVSFEILCEIVFFAYSTQNL